MAINVARYDDGSGPKWGVQRDGALIPIDARIESTREFMLEGVTLARAAVEGSGDGVPIDSVQILAPITRDRQFLCQAINYYSHMGESGIDPAKSPFNIFFRKAASCIAPADTQIVSPSHVEFLDYEVELGLVFSRDVSDPIEVTEANLADYVGGFVLTNDVSARDVQLPEMQFYKGKSYRTFGPTGPWLTLVDAADVARFDELRLSLSVNGETRQDSLTTDMIHRPAPTLTELSQIQDWEAGDLLATGTPGGCALQAPAAPLRLIAQLVSPLRRQGMLRSVSANNTKRLRPGDRVEASIRTADGTIDLGTQRNEVVAG